MLSVPVLSGDPHSALGVGPLPGPLPAPITTLTCAGHPEAFEAKTKDLHSLSWARPPHPPKPLDAPRGGGGLPDTKETRQKNTLKTKHPKQKPDVPILTSAPVKPLEMLLSQQTARSGSPRNQF